MNINKYLTPYNHDRGSINRIKYLVIHYVGASGGAKANCQWYAGGYRGASAHYFVDFSGEIWQSVEDQNIAWHCGAKSYLHPECRNANSIGIEMCVRNRGSQADTSRDWYFEEETVTAAIELTKWLMKKYGISPDHVIRHHDVTGKICPNPYVYNQGTHTWSDFKQSISDPVKKSGWYKDNGKWHFYLGDTGLPVTNDWYQDDTGRWAWFDGSGQALCNQWYEHENQWYYFGSDCYMCASQWIGYGGKQYYLTADGSMAKAAYVKSKDPHSGIFYWVNPEGVWEPERDTPCPDLRKYPVAE